MREVLFTPGEDPIGEYIRVNGIYYQVVGVVKPKPRVQIGGRTEESIMLPFTTLQQVANQGISSGSCVQPPMTVIHATGWWKI